MQDASFDLNEIYQEELDRLKRLEDPATDLRGSVKNTHFLIGNAYFMLSNIHFFRKEYVKAKVKMLQALVFRPTYPDCWNNLGTIYTFLHKKEKAKKCFEKAIEWHPTFSDPYVNMLIHLERSNDINSLKSYLENWKNISIIKNEWFLFKSRSLYLEKKYLEAKEEIEKINLKEVINNVNQFKLLYFTYKGFIEDRLKNVKESFECFTKASNFKAYHTYNSSSYINRINALKQNIIIDSVKQELPVIPFSKSKKLVFIVGFPRSGTTLLSAILDAHPQIKVKNENNFIGQLEDMIDLDFKIKLNNLKQLSQEQIKQLREKYFSLIDNNHDIFIDKVPLNLISLPLIKLLFPSAKILFCLRHPCDSVLSAWRQAFSPSDATANFQTLESCQSIYDKLMYAWCDYKACLDLDFYEVKYENLVYKNAEQILKILDFIGLNFHPDLTKYRELLKEKHDIATPDSYQVRLPIYTKAVNQWEKYESYIDMNCLEKWVKYFNY